MYWGQARPETDCDPRVSSCTHCCMAGFSLSIFGFSRVSSAEVCPGRGIAQERLQGALCTLSHIILWAPLQRSNCCPYFTEKKKSWGQLCPTQLVGDRAAMQSRWPDPRQYSLLTTVEFLVRARHNSKHMSDSFKPSHIYKVGAIISFIPISQMKKQAQGHF